MNDVPPDDESPIDQWIAVGFRRGLLTGVMCSVMAMALLLAGWWGL